MSPMLTLRYRKLWLAASVLILTGILVLSALPGPSLPAVRYSDKMGHFIAFVLLMVWFSGMFRFRVSPLVALGLLVYGILIELLQTTVSYRYAEFADVVFDFSGILVGWLVAAAGLRGWCQKVESWLPDNR